jgi:hypothetical protein
MTDLKKQILELQGKIKVSYPLEDVKPQPKLSPSIAYNPLTCKSLTERLSGMKTVIENN